MSPPEGFAKVAEKWKVCFLKKPYYGLKHFHVFEMIR